MTELIVYSKEKNLQCEELKDALDEVGVHYHEVDIRNPEAITELRKNGCFALEPTGTSGCPRFKIATAVYKR